MKLIRRHLITAVAFVLIIGAIAGATLFRQHTSIIKAVSDKNIVTDMEEIYNTKLSKFNDFINLYSMGETIIGTQLIDDAEYGHIIKDNNGKLYFPYDKHDISKLVENTVKFSEKLREKKVPFIYVQAPNKVIEGYTIFPPGGYNYANETADEFIGELNANNIDVFDLRLEILKDRLKADDLFYKTDHHWTTRTAFWAFAKTLEVLNKKYNLKIDENNYYRDLNNYEITEYKKSFLGSLGRRVGECVAGIDDFTFIEPDFETDYTVYYPVISKDTPTWEGNFRSTIARPHILESTDILANKHAAYFEYDYGNLIIKNNKVDNDVKILLIKDSFALPFAAYLSTCVSELHMIDLRDNDVPVPEEYILSNDFDVVMVLYNTEVFGNPMFNFVK